MNVQIRYNTYTENIQNSFTRSHPDEKKRKSHLKIAEKFACVNWRSVSSKSATAQLICGGRTNIAFI